MSDNEFSGVDLVLGSVRGFRSWRVDFEGKLSGVSHQDTWLPGENKSVCHGSAPKTLHAPQADGESWSEWAKRVDYTATTATWRNGHGIEACTHGFYAYFEKDKYDGYGSQITLNGIIEGYGEVVIGTKGFRAAKSKIIALALDAHQGVWRLEPLIIERLRANYRQVEFFESTFAMLAEFPLTSASEWSEAVLT